MQGHPIGTSVRHWVTCCSRSTRILPPEQKLLSELLSNAGSGLSKTTSSKSNGDVHTKGLASPVSNSAKAVKGKVTAPEAFGSKSAQLTAQLANPSEPANDLQYQNSQGQRPLRLTPSKVCLSTKCCRWSNLLLDWGAPRLGRQTRLRSCIANRPRFPAKKPSSHWGIRSKERQVPPVPARCGQNRLHLPSPRRLSRRPPAQST